MRAGRLLAALATVAATVVTTAPAAPRAAAAQVPEERHDVRVDVRTMTGSLTPESETFVIQARAVNTTDEPVRNLRAGLRIGGQLLGRSAIANGGPLARFAPRVVDHEVPGGELAPGGTADVEFEVPLADLPFDRNPNNAVYPLRIEVRSQYEVVGAADTYVVWWPQESAKLRIAMLWPLAEPGHRALGNDFYDDALGASVEDGRLDTLLRLGDESALPLTWVVDPELVDALRRMTEAYTVGGQSGTKGAAARAWLERARTALKDQSLLPLPYADPDLAATSTGPLAPDTVTAFRLGQDVLRRDLGTAGDSTLAWPPGNTLAPGVESLLAAQGVDAVVVPEEALPLAEQLNYTPTAPTPLAPGTLGSMTALVADAQLNRWVAEPNRAERPRLAVQRWLADTALTTMERPNVVRYVVITPPRTWDPTTSFASGLLQQAAKAPWLTPVPLGDLRAGPASTTPRTRAAAGEGLLDPAQVNRVIAQRRRVQRVLGILTDPKTAPPELARLDDALLRAVSAHWAGDPAGAQRLIDTVDAAVRAQVGRLRVIQGGVVTMTGRTGRIPLTFQNDLGQPVRIRLRIDSNQRLKLDGDEGYEARNGGEVNIPPGRHQIEIEGRATTGGLFPIKVDVLANDGTALGVGTTVRVRSTAYGAVALGATGVAFGLLVVASATRLLRRRRGARRAEPAPA